MNDIDEVDEQRGSEKTSNISPAQWSVVAIIVAVAAGSLLYKLLMHQQLGHSAAMFLGLPAVLAILLALTPKAKTVTGGILKGITLALLIVAPLLGEGYLCILIASPLFYLVGVVIGVIVDSYRRRRNATLTCISLFLLPMCLEGVIPGFHFNRAQTVEVGRVVDAPADLVEQALGHSPNLDTLLPAALRVGFPRPLQARGDGLAVGDKRVIHFSGAEGDPAGDLVMRVAEARPDYLRFETVSDGSKLTQWLRWTSSEVEWKKLDASHTRVVWRIHFDRQLDPAWYFIPWERAAVKQAANYLIDANATPVDANATPVDANANPARRD